MRETRLCFKFNPGEGNEGDGHRLAAAGAIRGLGRKGRNSLPHLCSRVCFGKMVAADDQGACDWPEAELLAPVGISRRQRSGDGVRSSKQNPSEILN